MKMEIDDKVIEYILDWIDALEDKHDAVESQSYEKAFYARDRERILIPKIFRHLNLHKKTHWEQSPIKKFDEKIYNYHKEIWDLGDMRILQEILLKNMGITYNKTVEPFGLLYALKEFIRDEKIKELLKD